MQTIKDFFKRDKFAEHAGIELLEVAHGYSKARMVLAPQHLNGFGVAHGGAIFTLADFAFAAAANSYGTLSVAVNCHISFMKAGITGTLHVECRELSKNFKLGTYTAEVRDDQGELVSIFQGMAYRKQDKLPV